MLAVNPPHDSQVDGKLLSILIASSFAMFAVSQSVRIFTIKIL